MTGGKLTGERAVPGALYADPSFGSDGYDIGVLLSVIGALEPRLAVEVWPAQGAVKVLLVPGWATWLELVDAP